MNDDPRDPEGRIYVLYGVTRRSGGLTGVLWRSGLALNLGVLWELAGSPETLARASRATFEAENPHAVLPQPVHRLMQVSPRPDEGAKLFVLVVNYNILDANYCTCRQPRIHNPISRGWGWASHHCSSSVCCQSSYCVRD